MANGVPLECDGETGDPAFHPPGEFERSGECGEFGESGGALAKFELRLVDT